MTLITRHVLSRCTTTTACRTKSYKCGVHGDGRQAAGDGQHAVVNVEPVAEDWCRHEHPDDVN